MCFVSITDLIAVNIIIYMDRINESQFPLIVRSIIGEPIAGLQQVSIDIDNFNLTVGKVSKLIPIAEGREAGSIVRKYMISGVEVLASYKRGDYKTDPEAGSRFFVDAKLAKELHVPYVAPVSNLAFGLAGFLKQNKKPITV